MPPSSTRAHVSIVLDGVQAQRILNALAAEAKNAKAELEQMKQQFAQGLIDEKALKAQERYVKQLEKDYSKNTKQLSDLNEVMKNLSSQTSRQLDAALRSISQVMKDVNINTEEGRKKMSELRYQQESITEQAKKLSLSYVDVNKTLRNLTQASTDHVQRAARQTADELAHMKTTDAAYKQQKRNLELLNAELDKRNGKMTNATAENIFNQKMTASVDDIKRAIDYYERLKTTMNKTDVKGIDNVNKKLAGLRKAQLENIQSQRDFNATMANLKTAPIEQLRAAEARLVEEIKHATGEQRDYADKAKQLQQVRAQIQGLTGDFQKQESSLKQVAQRLAAYVGVYGAFNFIKGQVTQLIQKNLEFSDTLSDIRKTTLMSEEAVALLSDRLKELDTRTSVIDVQKLAYEAGKLGITGVANVTEFVKAADQVNIALGEQLNGLESITELMKINSVLGTTQQYGIEQSLLKTGSAINYLSQTSTAVGSRMTDFTARLAGISASAHISTAEVLGLSAASDALKQQVEVSATAFNKLISQMFTHTKGVAEAVGIEFDTLKEKLEMGDTMDALLMVLDAVRKKGGLSETGPIMKDLGSDGARLLQVLNAMANNVDFVRDSVNRANKAFREGTSVTNEYNIKNENAAALWERLKNNMEKYFVSASNTGWFKEIIQDLQELPKWIDRMATGLLPVKLAVEAIVWSFKELSFVWAGFITAFTAAKVIEAIKSARLATIAWKDEIVKAEGAANKLKAAFNTNVYTIIIAALATAAYAYYDHIKKAREEAEAFGKAVASAYKEAGIEAQKLTNIQKEAEPVFKRVEQAQKAIAKATEEYGKNSEQAKKAQDELASAETERRVTISNFNSKYSTYLGYQLAETANYKDMERAIDAVNAKLRMKALLNAKGDREQAIIGDTSQGIEDRRGTLKQKFMDVTGKDEAAAAEALQYFRDHYDEILTKMENGLYGYGDTARQKLREYLKVSAETNVDSILISMSDYVNAINDRQKKIDKSNESFDAEIKANAKQHNDEIDPKVKDYWNQISFFVELSDKEQLAGIKAIKDGDIRDKRKKLVEEYLAAARLQAEDLRAIGTKESEARLKELNTAIGYAEKYLEKQPISTTPDKPNGNGNGNNEALRKARDEYNAIISKIEAYYQMQRQVVNDQYEKHEINMVERENRMRQIEQDLLQSRIVARKRISDHATEQEWKDEQHRMELINQAGQEGYDQLLLISEVGMDEISKLLKRLGGTAEWDAIFRKAEEDETKKQELRIKRIEAIEKMLLEGNPVGKLAAEYQRSFQELDIWFARFDKSTGETLKNFNERVMQAIYGLGDQAGGLKLDTPEGIEKGRTAIKNTGVFDATTVDAADPEMIRAFFVKAYKYVEDYKEASRKAAKESLDEWEKQYALSGDNKKYEERIKYLELTAKLSEKLEGYGYSEAIALEKRLEIAKQQYMMESNRLNAKKGKAEEHLQTAQNMADDPNEPNKKIEAIRAAQEELHQVEEEIRTTLPDLENAVLDAALTFEEFNQRWIASMSDATQQFIDSFIDFRSFYEDKGDYEGGTIWDNVFGTKEDREKAFGDFVDQLKKATRTAIMEKVKQRMSTQVQDRIELAWAKWFGKQKTKAQKDTNEESTGLEEAAGKAKEGIQKAVNDKLLADQKQHNNEEVAENGAKTSKNVALSLAEAVSKCFGQLGPIAGAVAVGVVTAVIGSFLTMALNAIGHDSHGKDAAAGAKTKLVSGMLTYDEGNVSNVLGDNGKTYRAVTDYAASGLVTRPTVTTVQGQPALVGEEGPELVVGREATRYLQLNRPDIVSALIGVEAHHRHRSARQTYGFRAFDDGNISSALGSGEQTDGAAVAASQGITEETAKALVTTMSVIADTFSRPIVAELNMNGKGGAVDKMAQGLLNSKRLGDLDSVKRLLGTK